MILAGDIFCGLVHKNNPGEIFNYFGAKTKLWELFTIFQRFGELINIVFFVCR